jgi:hypothetical protein
MRRKREQVIRAFEVNRTPFIERSRKPRVGSGVYDDVGTI